LFSTTDNDMTGGAAAQGSYATIYSYQVPQNGGYAPNGNILQHVDSVMGTWNYSYDAVDRLTTAAQVLSTPTSTGYAVMNGCWTYDSYGNRTSEAVSTMGCGSNPPKASWANYNAANNRVTTASTATAGYIYDAAGNTLFDGVNRYWYDAEGQLCAVQSLRYTGAPIIQYIYDGGWPRSR
jgi:hypothetical protein